MAESTYWLTEDDEFYVRVRVENSTDLVAWNVYVKVAFFIGGEDVTGDLNEAFAKWWQPDGRYFETMRADRFTTYEEELTVPEHWLDADIDVRATVEVRDWCVPVPEESSAEATP